MLIIIDEIITESRKFGGAILAGMKLLFTMVYLAVKSVKKDMVLLKKQLKAEMKSRINDKVKAGYITLNEVVDETGQPP